MRLTKTRAVALLVGAVLWMISPWDGDFLPVVGWIDDALIMALAIWTMYKSWQPPPMSRARSADEPAADDWAVLGVPRGASLSEIKKAYREQMALYHPDKVAHLGPELKRAAEKKTLEIQRAYERLSQ